MKGKKQPRFWRKSRIMLGVVGAILVIGATVLLFIGHSKMTKMSLDATIPTQTTFTDDNFVDFTNNLNTPDINNNRILSDVSPLIISYHWESGKYAPTFKMDLTNSDIAKNIKIVP